VAALLGALAVVLGVGIATMLVTGVVDLSPQADSTPAPSASETRGPVPEPVPTVLPAAASTPMAGSVEIADALGPVLAAGALGERVGVSVVDLDTGATAYQSGPGALIPASTLKILTAAAALDVMDADHRFTTRVVEGPARGQIVLVGGGDPTLTADDQAVPGRRQLSVLAQATAAALQASGTTSVRLLVDDTLFTGPAVDPDWQNTYVRLGVVGPVSALAVDGGRQRPDTDRRSADPALAAAAAFVVMLASHGIDVPSEPARGPAGAGATVLAAARSAPLSDIVEHMLAVSDNDEAEVLARHLARAAGRPATSEAAEQAIVQALAGLGIDVAGLAVLDGSGLARGSAVPPAVLTETLRLAGATEHPHLRAVLTGLPVAGFTGTLDDRFDSPAATDGVGLVRAKTGTLTRVSSLAGTVVARDGTAYAFAMMADDVSNAVAARSALDDASAALARCGCAVPAASP
jgi:D-alanyl-D-alanine carboxypeptidase/D-alanyl-D-alanine-endopeptidase (penicillin-binding protein 4)